MHENLTRMHIETQLWVVLRSEHQQDIIYYSTFYKVTSFIAVIVLTSWLQRVIMKRCCVAVVTV